MTEWLVTQRFVSVEGPDNCWIRQQRERLTGAVFPDVPMTVTRSNGSITVDSHGFLVTYTGTYSGAEFTATGVMPLPGGGGRGCDDDQKVHHQLDGVSNLSGRFSADDRRMTANEVNSYPLNTGGTATYTWSWEATRED